MEASKASNTVQVPELPAGRHSDAVSAEMTKMVINVRR
jgi:hypothetical protein